MTIHRRSRITRHLAWIVVLGLTTLGTSLQAGDITGIVAFGDSLSDVGNTYLAAGIPPSPPYYQGHYSNGPIWLEYLANSLGVPAPTASLAGGTDYAWGGAETGSGLSYEGTPNIGSQISTYLASNTPLSTQLITIWGGANDFLNGGVTNPAVPVANLISEITTLAAAGGKQFLVPNLPLLGDLPATNTLPQANRDALNFLTLTFDSMLYSQLNQLQGKLGITMHQVDIDSVFQNIIANPGAYGLTNVTDSAIADGNLSGQGYLFWDTVHPTTVIQALIGATAFATVVPEPSPLTLVLIAAPLLLAWRRRAAVTSPGLRPRDGSGRG
jgi:phospholipase/lecithinase/hemolysin